MLLRARRRSGVGEVLAQSPRDMARMSVDQLAQQTVTGLLETAFAEESKDFGTTPAELARYGLMLAGLRGHRGLVRFDAALDVSVIGLDASAATYYPAVGPAVRAEMVLPAHAGVANATAAVVGRLTMRRAGSVTSPAVGRFRVHFGSGPQEFSDCGSALNALEQHMTEGAQTDAAQAGCG